MTAIHPPHKVLNVQVPQLFKNVIDALNLDVSATSTVWVVAGSLILGCTCLHLLTVPISPPPSDGAARIGATVFGELLNAVFANIGQRAIRKVSRETFEHLLNLNLKFHLSRQTGGLTRAIDRGTKYALPISIISFLLTPQQGHHIYATGHSVSYRPYSLGDIHGVRHPCRCGLLPVDAFFHCIIDV